MNYLNSLSDVMNKLKEKGYNENYRLEKGELVNEEGKSIPKNTLTLVNTYRFEGMSNPADMSILYEITSKSGDKIMLIDSYGADDSENSVSNFVETI